MRNKAEVNYTIEDFWFLKLKPLWAYFKSESLAFKAICAYIFIEYFRPQSIFPVINFLPWAQLFLTIALVSLFADKKAKLKWTGIHTFIILFALCIHASFLVAFDIKYSTRNYIYFIQWIIVFFLIASIVTNKERFYVFFLVVFLCSIKVAFGTARIWVMRGFSFTSWGLKGPSGYFENSGELAILMLTLFPLGFYLFRLHFGHLAKWEKVVLLIAAVCPILTILGASSRGAQIALALQLIIMFWRKIFKPKVLIIGALVIWGGWQLLPQEQKLRFTSIGEDRTSIQRQLYWKHGWQMMKDHPVLGVGYYNFIPYYNAFHSNDLLYDRAELPHNIFIQIGTDGGFTALFFYLMLLTVSLTYRYPGRQKSDQDILFLIWKANKLSILGFVIAGQFVTVGYYPFLWICLALQAAMITALNAEDKAFKTGHTKRDPESTSERFESEAVSQALKSR